MPRLRNVNSGVVVSVSDETAGRLDSEWAPEEADNKSATKRSSVKSDSNK